MRQFLIDLIVYTFLWRIVPIRVKVWCFLNDHAKGEKV
jgi:hypothetical protein